MKLNKKIAAAEVWANSVVDKLDQPIDPGIKDTIIALRALKINTTGSCEGHGQRATQGPWIHIESPKAVELERPISAYRRRTKYKKPLTPHLLKVHMQIKLLNTRYATKVFALLAKFYQNRKTPFENRLILEIWGSGVTRLQCQGAVLSSVQSKQKRLHNLRAYQAEMRDFTHFLKNQL